MFRLVLFFILISGICAQAQEIPVIVVPKLSTPIVVDGNLDESAWKTVTWSKPFLLLNGKSDKTTSCFKITYDDTHLYLAMSFDLAQKTKLIARSSHDARDTNLWEEDCVEIFINPKADDLFNYYHLIINPNGARYDAFGMSSAWDANWVAATHIENGVWQTEVAIPFTAFDVPCPKDGEVWRLNVAREDKTSDQITAWSPTFSRSLHMGDRFGCVVFGTLTSRANKQIETIQKSVPSAHVSSDVTPKASKPRKVSVPSKKHVRLSELSVKDREALQKRVMVIWADCPEVYPKKLSLPLPFPKPLQEIRIRAAQNEHRATVVNLFNPQDQGLDVRVWISMVKGDDKVKWKHVQKACVFYRPIFVQSKIGKYMADPLPPLDPSGVITVPPGQCRQVWIDVDTHGLVPGHYRAVLNLKSLDRTVTARYWRFPLKIEVWPFKIANKMPITVQMWEYTEGRTPITPWLDDMVDHYVNGFFHSWTNALNHITDPEKIREQMVPAYTTRTGLQLKDTLLPKHQRGQIMFGYGVVELFEQRLAGRFKLKFMSPRWKKIFKEYILTMRDYLQSIGIGPKDYLVQLWDEADGGTARRVLKAGKFLKSFAPEIRTMMDVAIKHPPKKALMMDPVVDIWCPCLERIIAMPKDLELYRKTGKTLWAYQCPVGVTESSALEHCRKFPWWAWKLRLDGISYWVYDYPRSDPFDNYDWGGYPDTCMVYGDYRITSRRWESWREGMEDYLYLYLLKELIEKGKAAGLDKKTLSRYRITIGKQVNAVVHSRDPKVVELARLKLADDILKLKKLIR